MERLFAPWRIEWVRRDDRNPDIDGCVFCALPEREADRENRVLARSDRSFVILNNAPYNPGHCMVIPNDHVADYEALDDETLLDHARLKARTFDALRAALQPDGFNAGLNLGEGSGGSIGDHLHTHVVPRWSGDTNFMPILSETKVIVEALDDTYDALHAAFADQPGVAVEDDDRAVRVDEPAATLED